MVRLKAPLMSVGNVVKKARLEEKSTISLTRCSRRHIMRKQSTDTFDLSENLPTYMDTIGVPRGVPDEYKLVD